MSIFIEPPHEALYNNKDTIVLGDFIDNKPDYSELANKLELKEKEKRLIYKGVKYHLEIYSPNSEERLKSGITESIVCVGEAVNEEDQIIGL